VQRAILHICFVLVQGKQQQLHCEIHARNDGDDMLRTCWAESRRPPRSLFPIIGVERRCVHHGSGDIEDGIQMCSSHIAPAIVGAHQDWP